MHVMRLGVLVIGLLVHAAVIAEDRSLPEAVISDPGACAEGPIQQFGRYIGDWKITDQTRDPNTGAWSPGQGARWIFSCVGNGTMVQDFWLPNSGNFGTNLRRFNEETKSWEIIWGSNVSPNLDRIEAAQMDDGRIVMHYVAPLPTPLRRITFFPPDDEGWNWKLEISNDGGDTWVEGYRIRATPYVE